MGSAQTVKRSKRINTYCEKNERDQQQVWQEWKDEQQVNKNECTKRWPLCSPGWQLNGCEADWWLETLSSKISIKYNKKKKIYNFSGNVPYIWKLFLFKSPAQSGMQFPSKVNLPGGKHFLLLDILYGTFRPPCGK